MNNELDGIFISHTKIRNPNICEQNILQQNYK